MRLGLIHIEGIHLLPWSAGHAYGVRLILIDEVAGACGEVEAQGDGLAQIHPWSNNSVSSALRVL